MRFDGRTTHKSSPVADEIAKESGMVEHGVLHLTRERKKRRAQCSTHAERERG